MKRQHFFGGVWRIGEIGKINTKTCSKELIRLLSPIKRSPELF